MDKKNLDKIVGYLLDDIEIHYDYQSLQIIGSDIEYDIELLDYGYFYDMIDYKLEFDYGLNPNDCLYVYGNLLYQINKKMKDYGSINESINSRGDYLNKIVEYLLEDTEIDYNNRSVNLLFLHPPMLLYFFPYPLPSPILEYCKDVYGLNDDETNYVLREYKNTIVDKINNLPINESVDNKKIYLDKIVQYILDDTKLDYGRKEVIYPFIPNVRSQWGLLVPLYYVQYDSPFFNEYSKYCNDMYGLSYEESVYVWDHYKTRLIDKGSINESVDSKKIYLDKILDYIVEDTMINSRDWEPPFHLRKYLHSLPTPQYLFPYFYKYCNDNYGLTNDEVRSLWEPYLDRVDKLSRKKPY